MLTKSQHITALVLIALGSAICGALGHAIFSKPKIVTETKTVDKIVYKDQIVKQQGVSNEAKIVYKDRVVYRRDGSVQEHTKEALASSNAILFDSVNDSKTLSETHKKEERFYYSPQWSLGISVSPLKYRDIWSYDIEISRNILGGLWITSSSPLKFSDIRFGLRYEF